MLESPRFEPDRLSLPDLGDRVSTAPMIALPCSVEGFLGSEVTVEQAHKLLESTLKDNGFTVHLDKPVGIGIARLGYAELFEVTGPDNESLVIKFVGDRSREYFPLGITVYENIQKDLRTLLLAGDEACFPKHFGSVVSNSGEPLGVIVEKVDCAIRLPDYLESLAPEQKKHTIEALVSLVQRLSSDCKLECWDHSIDDVIIGPGNQLRFVDAGSFDHLSHTNGVNSARFVEYLKTLLP